MSRIRAWLLVVATLIISAMALPPGVAIVGAVLGGLSALLAIGLVLAYRAHRFLNLAHASLGGVAGSVVSYLVASAGWNFWLALSVGLVVGAALGVATGMLLGDRLADASRTVVVAASLGLAFVFGSIHVGLGLLTGSVLALEIPIPLTLDVFPVRLSGTHVFAALVVPVALIGVWRFLQRSDHGLRVRALAGSARHARRLGIDPHSTWRVLWLVIGLLAALAGIASQPLLGTTVERGPLLGPLLLALAAAAVGGMRDLPLTSAASIALGVAYQAIVWRSPIAGLADVGLLVVIVVVFAVRHSVSRLDERSDPPHHRLVRSPRPAPDRLRHMLTAGRVLAAAALIALAIVVVPTMPPGSAQRVGAIGIFVLAGLAVHVVATYRGTLPLGMWAIVGISTFVAARIGGGGVAGVVAGVLTATVVSPLVAFLARGGSIAYPAVTLATAFAFGAGARHLPVSAVTVDAIGPVAIGDTAAVAIVIVVASACVALSLSFLRQTRLGRDALALREDTRLAATHGVRAGRTRFAIDCVAGTVAGLAGVLYLWNQQVVHPDAFGAVRSLELVALTITGGIGSVLGPFLGGAVVKGSELFASGPMHLFATGTGLLVVVVWLRGGLVSLVEVIRTRLNLRGAADLPAQTPAVVARFCPAPAAETRKARHDETVRHLATTVLALTFAGGSALRSVAAGHDPAPVVWIVAGSVVLGAIGAAAGHARPRLVGAAAATLGVGLLALVWAPVASVVAIPVGYAIGAALGTVGGGVPHALAHAARGWITLQAAVGIALGAALSGSPQRGAWLVGGAIVGLLVAAGRRARVTRSEVTARPDAEALQLVAATATLGGTSVLRGAELRVRAGEIVGIVGVNGIGKTTLLRAIAGEVPLERGSVALRHTDLSMLSTDERFRLGVLLSDGDEGSNGELTVRENLRIAALSVHPRSAAGAVADVVGRLHPSLVERLDERAAVLSGGERRLLALAQIAIVQPSVLLVDELARGLSSEAVRTYRALLRGLAENGTAVVLVDHDIDGMTDLANRVLRLTGGRLVPDRRAMSATRTTSRAFR